MTNTKYQINSNKTRNIPINLYCLHLSVLYANCVVFDVSFYSTKYICIFYSDVCTSKAVYRRKKNQPIHKYEFSEMQIQLKRHCKKNYFLGLKTIFLIKKIVTIFRKKVLYICLSQVVFHKYRLIYKVEQPIHSQLQEHSIHLIINIQKSLEERKVCYTIFSEVKQAFDFRESVAREAQDVHTIIAIIYYRKIISNEVGRSLLGTKKKQMRNTTRKCNRT